MKYVSGLSVCRMIGVRLLYYPSNNSTNTCREFILGIPGFRLSFRLYPIIHSIRVGTYLRLFIFNPQTSYLSLRNPIFCSHPILFSSLLIHLIQSIRVGIWISLFIFFLSPSQIFQGQSDPACFIGVDG